MSTYLGTAAAMLTPPRGLSRMRDPRAVAAVMFAISGAGSAAAYGAQRAFKKAAKDSYPQYGDLSTKMRRDADMEHVRFVTGARLPTKEGAVLRKLIESSEGKKKAILTKRYYKLQKAGKADKPFLNAMYFKTSPIVPKTSRKMVKQGIRLLFPPGKGPKITDQQLDKGIIIGHSKFLKEHPEIIGHELGHGRENDRMGEANRIIQEIGRPIGGGVAALGITAPLLFSGSKRLRKVNPFYAGAGLAAIGALPLLWSEAVASKEGRKLLNKTKVTKKDRKKMDHLLNAAYMTYLAHGVIPPAMMAAAPSVIRRVVKK